MVTLNNKGVTMIKSQFIETVFQLVNNGMTDRIEILEFLRDGNYPECHMMNVDSALHLIRIKAYPGEPDKPTPEGEDGQIPSYISDAE